MSGPVELDADEQAWEDGERAMPLNPIIQAFLDHVVDVHAGENDPEEGLSTTADVVERWVWYLAEGEQEVSWHPPILAQANAYFEFVCGELNLPYRPGLTHAVA